MATRRNAFYVTLTDTNFEEKVVESKRPVLVEFEAGWSGLCHILEPTMKELAKRFRRQVQIGKLNVEQNRRIADKYDIHTVPTLLFFRDGQVVDHIVGAAPRGAIAAKLCRLLEA